MKRRGVSFVDAQGGVFRPAPGALRVAWSYGQGAKREAMFSCPVSAIPGIVFDLLELWRDCRTLRVLPLAGGYLDQPLLVRRAFPIFEREAQALEAPADASAALAQLLTGGGAPPGSRRS